MASVSIFLSLPVACYVEGPFPSMYGVWFSILGGVTNTSLWNKVESKAFRLINSLPLTDCLDSLSHSSMLNLYLTSTAIFYLTLLLNLLTECLHLSRCLVARGFLLLLIPILSISIMQVLTVIFILSSHTLVNSEIFFHCLFFHMPMILSLSKEYKMDLHPLLLFLLLSSLQGMVTNGIFVDAILLFLDQYPYYEKKGDQIR